MYPQGASVLLAHLTLLVAVVIGCSPGRSAPQGQGAEPAAPAAPQRTLVIANKGEPPALAVRALVQYASALSIPSRIFNATLDYRDEREIAHPYLAEALPQLSTDTWQIFPDGRMETRYRLKPGLIWQDGTPLAAEDFAFAYRVYATPELGSAAITPVGQMQEIAALDPQTVAIRWKQPFPAAGLLLRGFQALPRHILEEPFRTLDPVAFTSQRYWTSEYIGLGPYKLSNWEPGAFIEGVAFDGHVLGKSRIDRVKIVFVNDPQTTMARVLAGEIHYVADFIFDQAQGQTLEQTWTASRGGSILYSPVLLRIALIQARPEYQLPAALSDVRVRYALAHALDHQQAVDVLTDGKGVISPTMTPPGVPYYAEIERVIIKQPFDPRRSQQLLEEAGFVKGADGIYNAPDGKRATISVSASAGAHEPENAVYADFLRRVGFDAYQQIVPVVQLDDPQFRATLPGLSLGSGGTTLGSYISAQLASPENRWRGSNRPGWSNSEYDRLYAAYDRTFPENERVGLIAQMERILSVERPLIPMYFDVNVNSVVGSLGGPVARLTPDAGDPLTWIHTWEWRS